MSGSQSHSDLLSSPGTWHSIVDANGRFGYRTVNSGKWWYIFPSDKLASVDAAPFWELLGESSEAIDCTIWRTTDMVACVFRDAIPLDVLCDQHGLPPAELINDWQQQLASATSNHHNNATTTTLVGSDARLWFVDALSQSLSVRPATPPPDMPPFTPEFARSLEMLSGIQTLDYRSLADLIASTASIVPNSVVPGQELLLSDAASSTVQLADHNAEHSREEAKNNARPLSTSKVSPSKIATRKTKSVPRWYFAVGGLAAAALIIGALSMWPSATKTAAESVEETSEQNIAQEESASVGPLIVDVEPKADDIGDLDLSGLPSTSSVENAVREPIATDLTGRAAMGSLDGIASLNLDDLLNSQEQSTSSSPGTTNNDSNVTAPNSVGPQTNGAPAVDLSALGTTSPVFEDDNELADNGDAAQVTDDTVMTETPVDSPSFETQYVDLTRPLVKLRLKSPPGYQSSNASVRVNFDVPENMVMEPSTPLEISGAGMDSRTFFIDDEGAAVRVYVKNVPKTTWKVQLAARVVINSHIEVFATTKTINELNAQVQQMIAITSEQQTYLSQIRNHPRANLEAIVAAEDMLETRQTELAEIATRVQQAFALVPMIESGAFAELISASSLQALPAHSSGDIPVE